MIEANERWQMCKDALMPLFIALSLILAIVFYKDGPSGAMNLLFESSPWFIAVWYFSLFVSTAATFIGVLLRHFKKPAFIYLEYPGSLMASAFIWVYTAALFGIHAHNLGSAIFAICISFILGVHFFFNFMKIQTAVFGSFSNKR